MAHRLFEQASAIIARPMCPGWCARSGRRMPPPTHTQKSSAHTLQAGADVNEVSERGMTPLHFAVNGGHREVVLLLLQANVRARLPHPVDPTKPPS
eukprot:300094-Chlamydomonas_euryale.AAC.2